MIRWWQETFECDGKNFSATIETSDYGKFVSRIYQIVAHPRNLQGVKRQIFPRHPLNESAKKALAFIGSDQRGRIVK